MTAEPEEAGGHRAPIGDGGSIADDRPADDDLRLLDVVYAVAISSLDRVVSPSLADFLR